jgi:hypothetical protein
MSKGKKVMVGIGILLILGIAGLVIGMCLGSSYGLDGICRKHPKVETNPPKFPVDY